MPMNPTLYFRSRSSLICLGVMSKCRMRACAHKRATSGRQRWERNMQNQWKPGGGGARAERFSKIMEVLGLNGGTPFNSKTWTLPAPKTTVCGTSQPAPYNIADTLPTQVVSLQRVATSLISTVHKNAPQTLTDNLPMQGVFAHRYYGVTPVPGLPGASRCRRRVQRATLVHKNPAQV